MVAAMVGRHYCAWGGVSPFASPKRWSSIFLGLIESCLRKRRISLGAACLWHSTSLVYRLATFRSLASLALSAPDLNHSNVMLCVCVDIKNESLCEGLKYSNVHVWMKYMIGNLCLYIDKFRELCYNSLVTQFHKSITLGETISW